MDGHSKSVELLELGEGGSRCNVSESISVNRSYTRFLPKQNVMLGYGYMFIAVLGISMSHIFSKVCYFYNPRITNIDSLLFFGFWMIIYYIPAAKYNHVSFSYRSYKRKAFIILMLSVFLSLLINFLNLLGISLMYMYVEAIIRNMGRGYCFTIVFSSSIGELFPYPSSCDPCTWPARAFVPTPLTENVTLLRRDTATSHGNHLLQTLA